MVSEPRPNHLYTRQRLDRLTSPASTSLGRRYHLRFYTEVISDGGNKPASGQAKKGTRAETFVYGLLLPVGKFQWLRRMLQC